MGRLMKKMKGARSAAVAPDSPSPAERAERDGVWGARGSA